MIEILVFLVFVVGSMGLFYTIFYSLKVWCELRGYGYIEHKGKIYKRGWFK
jgi:hypothetical protein